MAKATNWYRGRRMWLALGTVLALLLVWMCVRLIGTQTLRDLKAQDWAAWVQAIGSIGAILAAAGVVVLQHRLERKRADERRDDRQRQQLVMAVFVAQELAAFCEHALKSVPDAPVGRVRSMARSMKGDLRALQEVCARLDPTESTDEGETRHMVLLVATIVTLLEHVENIHEHAYAEADGRPQLIRFISTHLKRVQRARNGLVRVFGRLPPARGGDASLQIEFGTGLRDPYDW